MHIGDLRRRITIQQQSSIQDSYGEPVNTWTDIATVWASVNPINGREFFAGMQVKSEITTRITIRYLSTVKSSMRAIYRDITYDIQSVIDLNERHREMELMCRELV